MGSPTPRSGYCPLRSPIRTTICVCGQAGPLLQGLLLPVPAPVAAVVVVGGCLAGRSALQGSGAEMGHVGALGRQCGDGALHGAGIRSWLCGDRGRWQGRPEGGLEGLQAAEHTAEPAPREEPGPTAPPRKDRGPPGACQVLLPPLNPPSSRASAEGLPDRLGAGGATADWRVTITRTQSTLRAQTEPQQEAGSQEDTWRPHLPASGSSVPGPTSGLHSLRVLVQGSALGFLLGPQTCPQRPLHPMSRERPGGAPQLQGSGHWGEDHVISGRGEVESWGGGVSQRGKLGRTAVPTAGGGDSWRQHGMWGRPADLTVSRLQRRAEAPPTTAGSATSPTARPSPPPQQHPQTTHLCLCCQARHGGCSTLALQPGLGLPFRAPQGHALHLDIHSLGYSSPSHTHYIPLSPFLLPASPHSPTHLPSLLPRPPQPSPHRSPSLLTGFPGCTTGISVEWPRPRGALASCGNSWVFWVPQETDSLRPPSWVCLWRRGCPVSSAAALPHQEGGA